jgi:hypothetical protein
MYFLSPGQPPQDPLTDLLVINKTGEHGAETRLISAALVGRVPRKQNIKKNKFCVFYTTEVKEKKLF